MNINTSCQDGVTTLRLEGLFHGGDELAAEIERVLALSPRRVVFDLSRLKVDDDAGVTHIAAALKRLRERGGRVTVTGLRDHRMVLFVMAQPN